VGLAPIVVRDVFDAMRDLNARGTTILVVEQLARLALEMAHRAYVMERGRVVLEGTGRALLDNPEVRSAYLGG
jgi:branched-chain amino acid transport system ATP-binding protein